MHLLDASNSDLCSISHYKNAGQKMAVCGCRIYWRYIPFWVSSAIGSWLTQAQKYGSNK